MVLRTRIAHKRAEDEKEKIQVQLLQARKMEAIGILAGGVAHDFNNLLTAILGCVDMAIMDMDESNPALKDLKEIQASAQRAAELTKQLLLFSRKQPMRFLPINLNEIVDDLSKMLHRLIGEDIVLKTELEKALWSVRADRGTMEQVMMNLTVNAKDAMPNGGELKVTTENIVLNETQCENIPEAQAGRWVRISVSDTGIGIDRKTIRHIFEPFFSTKEVGEGTGLGLSVVYGIVKQHDGWMNVTSEAGQGSTFQVYLPVFRAKPEKNDKKKNLPRIKKSQMSDTRILVVEDEERIREFTANGLNRNGYSVFCAANAHEASSIFQKEKGNFKVVLCDVVLPDKNGLELVDELLDQKPHLGVLMCSGYDGKRSQRSTIRERGFRFLEKPYTLTDLLHVMHDVTQSLPA
jgi:nitrogen-specific signal transduction histidine kinase/ActR/RegA family two-component response regulator